MYFRTPLGNDIREKGFIDTTNLVPTDKSDKRAHATGIAPNFVHSLDACHLQETVNSMDKTCSFAMIHDSFGVHVADSPQLAKTLRKVFVDMYSNDILNTFINEQEKEIGIEQPSKGTLDLSKVLEDEFFFS
jgi:DNA-directed RNA polymerase